MKDLRRKRDTVVAELSVGQILLILGMNIVLWLVAQLAIGYYVRETVWR